MDEGIDQELVSVVVPTYERSAMLLRALDSVNSQTYSPIEVIVVDDNGIGSEQQLETEKRVASFHPRPGVAVKYIPRVKNGGGAAARNTGIEVSDGDYVGFLDDDDEFLPQKIELQVRVLRETAADVSYAHCVPDNRQTGGDTHYQHSCEGYPLFEQAYYGCLAATTQMIVRKEALTLVGGFTDSPSKQDSILLYKLLLAGCRVCCVPKVLSLYHQDPGLERISTRGKTLVGERVYSQLIRDSYDRFTLSQRRRIEHAIRWREGRLLLKQGKWLEALPLLLGSFALAPASAWKRITVVVGRKAKSKKTSAAGQAGLKSSDLTLD